jgi:hypothetical protein
LEYQYVLLRQSQRTEDVHEQSQDGSKAIAEEVALGYEVVLEIRKARLGKDTDAHSDPFSQRAEDIPLVHRAMPTQSRRELGRQTRLGDRSPVNIANGPEFDDPEGHPPWPLAGRAEWAERLKSQLLDPEGMVRWQERQDHAKEMASQKKEERAQTRAKQTCLEFSSEEECAEFYQQRQDYKDKRSGRVRKAKKVAGPCGRQHMCLLCFLKGGSDRYEAARNCREPGYCNVVDETTS